MYGHFKNVLKAKAKDILYAGRMRRAIGPLGDQDLSGTIQASLKSAECYVASCATPSGPGYCFTTDRDAADIYSTSYAVAFLGLTGKLDTLSSDRKGQLVNFLNSYQDIDGLFRDPLLATPLAETCHHWGWQHLLPHVLIALDYLGAQPTYDFAFLDFIFARVSAESWVNTAFSDDKLTASNRLMNVAVALQYAADFQGSARARALASEINNVAAVQIIPDLLRETNSASRMTRSRIIKTIYHLLPTIAYEGNAVALDTVSLVRETLKTQNSLGGFGASIVSDSCEDIDSVYILAALKDSSKTEEIEISLTRFLDYTFANQNPDGGFVFRRFFPFRYGDCDNMSAAKDQSNMFATWFRTLAIAYATHGLNGREFGWKFSNVPGYQYMKR